MKQIKNFFLEGERESDFNIYLDLDFLYEGIGKENYLCEETSYARASVLALNLPGILSALVPFI